MNAHIFSLDSFTPELPEVEPGALVAQGRIVDAIVGGRVLRGSRSDLARRLNVLQECLTAAIGELAEAGWLEVDTEADGGLAIRWAA